MGLLDSFTGGKENKGSRLKQIFEAAKSTLNLSADQEQRIEAIFKNFRQDRRELKDENGTNMQDEIKTARKEAKQQLMAVLNDDQRKIIQQNLNEARNKLG